MVTHLAFSAQTQILKIRCTARDFKEFIQVSDDFIRMATHLGFNVWTQKFELDPKKGTTLQLLYEWSQLGFHTITQTLLFQLTHIMFRILSTNSKVRTKPIVRNYFSAFI